jgi:hypothetical protein
MTPILLTGTQYIAKNDRRPDELDQVRIALCLFDTVDQHNDLAVSFTVPITYHGSRDEETERITWDQAKKDFVDLVTSLTIKPGLFKAPSDSWQVLFMSYLQDLIYQSQIDMHHCQYHRCLGSYTTHNPLKYRQCIE